MADPVFPDRNFLIGRANRCRSLASTFLDPILRERMLDIACSYEEMAEAADTLKPLQSIRVNELER